MKVRRIPKTWAGEEGCTGIPEETGVETGVGESRTFTFARGDKLSLVIMQLSDCFLDTRYKHEFLKRGDSPQLQGLMLMAFTKRPARFDKSELEPRDRYRWHRGFLRNGGNRAS